MNRIWPTFAETVRGPFHALDDLHASRAGLQELSNLGDRRRLDDRVCLHRRDGVAHLAARHLAGRRRDDFLEARHGAIEAEIRRRSAVVADDDDLVLRLIADARCAHRHLAGGDTVDRVLTIIVGQRAERRADDGDLSSRDGLAALLIDDATTNRSSGGGRRSNLDGTHC